MCFLHAISEFGKDKNHEIDMKKCVTTGELADINKQRADKTRETFCSSWSHLFLELDDYSGIQI